MWGLPSPPNFHRGIPPNSILQHQERSSGCEGKPGELERELISHELVAARGINAGKRLPSAMGRERGTFSDFRSARSCFSHAGSKMEPALALLYPRQNPRACPGLSGEHSRALDPPQPADAKAGICSTPACVQHCQQLDRDRFGQQRAEQLRSWLLTREGLGEQLPALPGTPEPQCQPEITIARRAPCPGIPPCPSERPAGCEGAAPRPQCPGLPRTPRGPIRSPQLLSLLPGSSGCGRRWLQRRWER